MNGMVKSLFDILIGENCIFNEGWPLLAIDGIVDFHQNASSDECYYESNEQTAQY
jgi:hypothetical protein